MRWRWHLLTILSLCTGAVGSLGAASLEEPATLHAPDDVGWNLATLRSLPDDAGAILTSPARWGVAEWSLAAGLAGIGVGLYASDGRIQDWAQRHRTAGSDRLARDVMPFGSTYLLYELGAFAAASPFVEDPRVTRTALLGGESLAFALVGYEVVQLAANRSRPSQGASRDTWGGPQWPNRGHSFPSGHATAAFAMATVVAHEWRTVPGVAPLAYALATAVAAARVDVNAHWASDVVAGAVLGWAMGTAVEHCHPRGRQRLTMTPILDGRREGVALTWAF